MCWEYLKSVDVSGEVTAIAAAVTAGAAVFAVIIAKKQLKTWREQLIGTERRKLAVDMHKSALRFQLAIRQCRCPVYEWSFQKFDDAYWKIIQEERVKPVEEAFQNLVDKSLDLTVNLKRDMDSTLEPFNKLRTELILAIGTVFRSEMRPTEANDGNANNHHSNKVEQARLIWRRPLETENTDEYGDRVNSAVNNLAEQLKDFI